MTSQHGDRSLGSVAVVIAAAGRGERLGGDSPKALETIAGVTLLGYCLDVVSELPGLGALVIAAPPTHIDEVTDAVASGAPAVVPGLPVVDTIKEVDADSTVVRTVDRAALRGVQTPQGFDRKILVAVHADERFGAATDDAGMVEASGGVVTVIPGHQDAFKVTTPFDRTVAEALVSARNGAN